MIRKNRRGMSSEAILYTVLALAAIFLIIMLVKTGIINAGTKPLPGEDGLNLTLPAIVGAFLASRRAKHHNF